MILDTNAVSALLAGDEALAGALGSLERVHLPVIVLGEYRSGLARSRYRPQLEPLLETLVEASIVLGVDEGTSRSYAAVREELRSSGRPLPENDVWIGALARQHALAVVSRDTHFDAIAGIERIAW